MWKKVLMVSVLAGGVFSSATLSQLVTPLGGEFQVNSYTTGYQIAPAVAVRSDRSFVVVWYGGDAQDGDGWGVFGQRFAAEGSPQGEEFQINTSTTGDQALPALAMDAGGSFVVVWQSSSGGNLDIMGQRFTSGGDPQGEEFVVNSYTTNTQWSPAVAGSAEGNFVVVWASAPQDGSVFGITGRRFASDGTPQGSEFQVNTYTTGRQYSPAVAKGRLGEIIVVWHGDGLGTSGQDIMGQRYTDLGIPVGDEFRINAYTPGSQIHPAIAKRKNGESIVVWSSNYVVAGSAHMVNAIRAFCTCRRFSAWS